MSNINFNCDTGIFIFTALLAIFAFFQWQAVEKQNRQSLFKMRLEYYIKVKEYLENTFINFSNIQFVLDGPESQTKKYELKDSILKTEIFINNAAKESRELSYLFGAKMGFWWSMFFNSANRIAQNIKESSNELIKIDLQELANKQRIIIELFNEALILDSSLITQLKSFIFKKIAKIKYLNQEVLNVLRRSSN